MWYFEGICFDLIFVVLVNVDSLIMFFISFSSVFSDSEGG